MKARLIIPVLSLIIVLTLAGCGVSTSDYKLLEDKSTRLEAGAAALLSEKETLQSQVVELEVKISQVEAALEAIKLPSNFPSRLVLEQWAVSNVQPKTPSIQSMCQSVLAVQRQGIKDGYLISLSYDEDDSNSDKAWVLCGAMAGNRYYLWDPEIGDIYNYADFLVDETVDRE